MKKILNIPKNIIDFFKGVFQEIKLVDFPSFKESGKMTYIVILISTLFTMMLLGLDYIFTTFRNYLTTM